MTIEKTITASIKADIIFFIIFTPINTFYPFYAFIIYCRLILFNYDFLNKYIIPSL